MSASLGRPIVRRQSATLTRIRSESRRANRSGHAAGVRRTSCSCEQKGAVHHLVSCRIPARLSARLSVSISRWRLRWCGSGVLSDPRQGPHPRVVDLGWRSVYHEPGLRCPRQVGGEQSAGPADAIERILTRGHRYLSFRVSYQYCVAVTGRSIGSDRAATLGGRRRVVGHSSDVQDRVVALGSIGWPAPPNSSSSNSARATASGRQYLVLRRAPPRSVVRYLVAGSGWCRRPHRHR